MLATYMRRMRNNNLEITIAGSSCRQQKVMISFLALFIPQRLGYVYAEEMTEWSKEIK